MSDLLATTPDPAPAVKPDVRSSWLGSLLPDNRRDRWLLVLPALSALCTLLAMTYMTGAFDRSTASERAQSADGPIVDGFVVWIVLYNLLPPLVQAALIVLGAEFVKRGMPAVAVGSVAYTVFTGALLADMLFGGSSTSALLLLVLPVPLGLLQIVVVIAALVVHRLRRPSTAGLEA